MGDYRYYLSPENVISANDLPEGWGLLHTDGKKVWQLVSAKRQRTGCDSERTLLVSIMRRLFDGCERIDSQLVCKRKKAKPMTNKNNDCREAFGRALESYSVIRKEEEDCGKHELGMLGRKIAEFFFEAGCNTRPTNTRDAVLEEAAEFVETHAVWSSTDGFKIEPIDIRDVGSNNRALANAIRALKSAPAPTEPTEAQVEAVARAIDPLLDFADLRDIAKAAFKASREVQNG